MGNNKNYFDFISWKFGCRVWIFYKQGVETTHKTNESLVAIRRIKDFVKNTRGVAEVEISDEILRCSRHSRTIYDKFLEIKVKMLYYFFI